MDRIKSVFHDVPDAGRRAHGSRAGNYAKAWRAPQRVRLTANSRTGSKPYSYHSDVTRDVARALTWTDHHSSTKLEESGVFLVALQELDRNALRPADEADAHPGPDSGRLLRELDALGLDLGGDRVDVFHGQAEMVETLIGRHRRGIDAVARSDGRDEHIGATEFDVDPPRATDDLASENVLQPCGGALGIGAAQMNMVPGDGRHLGLPILLLRR